MKTLSLCLLLVAAVAAVRNDAALSEAAMSAPVPKAASEAPEAALVEESSAAAGGVDAGADLTAAATSQIAAALGLEGGSEGESEGDGAADGGNKRGFLKVLYDELKKLSDGSFQPMPTASSTSSLSGPDPTDPRVATLEKRLAVFERQRQKVANHAQDSAIAGINDRLAGLDKTLAALKRSAEQQSMLAQQLLRGAGSGPDSVDTRPDFSVLYAKASLPADFDARVQEILDTVRVEARKIYEKHCANTPRPGTGTPKSYPREKTPKLKPKPAVKGKGKGKGKGKKGKKKRSTRKSTKYPALPVRAPSNPNAEEHHPHVKHEKPVKLLKPIIKGKEPTPQEFRKLKAMLDLQKKLPITPAYHLPSNQKALQDVLGEDAVSAKWKNS